MSRGGAGIGVSDHYGWAVLVTVADDGTLLDRRRVELIDSHLPASPHHHEAQALPLEQALDLVKRVRASAERHTKRALDAVASTVPAPIGGIAIRECPLLPTTIAERIVDYWVRNRADSVMYREVFAELAESRGWSVHWYNPTQVLDAACVAMHAENIDAHFRQVRRTIGPPWGKDHKLAMAAAITIFAREDRL